MFLHPSVILFTEGGVLAQAQSQVGGFGVWPGGRCLGPDPGGRLGGLAQGVSRPTPGGMCRPRLGGGCPGPGWGVSQHALRQTPLLWAVRILLEYILVLIKLLA